MSAPIVITRENGRRYFSLERLDADAPVMAFRCRIPEYAAYLREDARRSRTDHIALTWILTEFSGKRRKTISMRLDLYS